MQFLYKYSYHQNHAPSDLLDNKDELEQDK